MNCTELPFFFSEIKYGKNHYNKNQRKERKREQENVYKEKSNKASA